MAESLLQKKKDTVVEKEKKCIVTPSSEVAILHNANLDMEVRVIGIAYW